MARAQNTFSIGDNVRSQCYMAHQINFMPSGGRTTLGCFAGVGFYREVKS